MKNKLRSLNWKRIKEEFWETILFILIGMAFISFSLLIIWLFAAGLAAALDTSLWHGFVIELIFIGAVFLIGVIAVIIKEWRNKNG